MWLLPHMPYEGCYHSHFLNSSSKWACSVWLAAVCIFVSKSGGNIQIVNGFAPIQLCISKIL